MAGGQPKSLRDWLVYGCFCVFGTIMLGILYVLQFIGCAE